MILIEQTYLIAATPAQVWQALTDPEIIAEWSGADAEYEPSVGTDYALWDGTITGGVLDVVPFKKLVQTWKPKDWTVDNSVVTFTLTAEGKHTRVDLLHENVEPSDFDGTREGWNLYYLGAIKKMLEAGTPLKRTAKRTNAEKKRGAPKKNKSGASY